SDLDQRQALDINHPLLKGYKKICRKTREKFKNKDFLFVASTSLSHHNFSSATIIFIQPP
ncbi:MAG: hypothetical protein II563_09030, partial [Treponema sp.]|nr:hypothetical protein [Treponema sp.]